MYIYTKTIRKTTGDNKMTLFDFVNENENTTNNNQEEVSEMTKVNNTTTANEKVSATTEKKKVQRTTAIKKLEEKQTIKQIYKNKEKLRFDLIIQRNNVWKPEQKSLFIHSILYGFPFTNAYAQDTNDGNWWLLDGKQVRL